MHIWLAICSELPNMLQLVISYSLIDLAHSQHAVEKDCLNDHQGERISTIHAGLSIKLCMAQAGRSPMIPILGLGG